MHRPLLLTQPPRTSRETGSSPCPKSISSAELRPARRGLSTAKINGGSGLRGPAVLTLVRVAVNSLWTGVCTHSDWPNTTSAQTEVVSAPTRKIVPDGQVRDLVERMLKSSGRRIDLSSPFVSAIDPRRLLAVDAPLQPEVALDRRQVVCG